MLTLKSKYINNLSFIKQKCSLEHCRKIKLENFSRNDITHVTVRPYKASLLLLQKIYFCNIFTNLKHLVPRQTSKSYGQIARVNAPLRAQKEIMSATFFAFQEQLKNRYLVNLWRPQRKTMLFPFSGPVL
jgi:hypothetical protein